MHSIEKETFTHQNTAKKHIPTTFRPLSEIPDYQPQFFDPHYQRDPYWDNHLYNQEKVEFKHSFDKLPEKIKDDDIFTDSHVSDKHRYALIDFWTVNPQLTNTSSLPNFRPPLNFEKRHYPVIDTGNNPQLQSVAGKNTKFLPLSWNLHLKNKKRMLHIAMDLGEIILDGFIDTGALMSAVSDADLQRIQFLAFRTFPTEGPPRTCKRW